MMTFEVKEKLIGDGIAVSEVRGIPILSDVGAKAAHPYGPSPAETIGNAFGSCVLINLQKLAEAHGIKFSGAEIKISIYRDETIPKIVELEYLLKIDTDAEDSKLELLNDLALKYSTTYNTLKDSVQITGKAERANQE